MEKNYHILLIDDDRAFNFLNEKIIEFEKFATKISSHVSPVEALEELKDIAQSNPPGFPDFIFLDINMPDMDGWEFMDNFRQLPAEVIAKTRVFILTSSLNPLDIEKSKTYEEIKGFASKPLTTEILNFIRSEKTNQFIVLT
ncbi:MAG: response regulator [Chitinophagales bacterium]|nr:response regulator [Chitinophagales bacterium]